MDVEPARPVTPVHCQFMDSMRLLGKRFTPPRNSQLPVIEHVTNLNNFRIIAFNWLSIGAKRAISQDEMYLGYGLR